jgi:hypothetical protein
MNKEQQIEEIAGTICNTCKDRFEISKKCKNVIEPCLAAYAHAESIYNAGYRKIDDNCAVITKDELKQYKVQAVKEFAEKVKMEFFYEFDEIIPSIMSDRIDELLKDYER